MKIQNIWRIALMLLLFFTTSSCEDDDEWSSNVIVYATITTSNDSSTVSSGDMVIYKVQMICNESTLNELKIYSIDKVDGITNLSDVSISGSEYTYYFEYKALEYTSSEVEVSIKFEASDNLGNTDTYTSKITVVSSYNPLTELSNLTLYGALSSGANGYNIASNQWLYTATTVDSTLVDIYDVAPESGDELSCEWQSMSGLKFARLTGFDYSAATNTSVASGWSLAVKLDKITSLKNDDVIFVGKDDDTVLAAIKINNIYDETGSANDRYNISIKKIDSN